MNKIIILIVTFFLTNIYSQEIETENWITDLNFLKTELPKKHKNLFFKMSKNEFEKGIEKIIKQLDKDTDIETSLKLHQLIAKIGDSHTTLSTSHISTKRKIIPLDFMWFKEGLFISGTTASGRFVISPPSSVISARMYEEFRRSLISDNTSSVIKFFICCSTELKKL